MLVDIIKCYLNYYKKYMCYNLYSSIENSIKFLEKKNKGGIEIATTQTQTEYENNNIITSEEQLKKMIFFTYNISNIVILYKETFDTSILKCQKNFEKLQEIKLVGNNIKDISFLLENDFPVLKILDLAKNNIGNDIIPVLKKTNFKKLKELNLYHNLITDVNIFENVVLFPDLELFYIGENKFILDGSNKFFPFPKSVKEFGLTGNFKGEDINFIKRLGVNNLEILYMSRNEITNLRSINDIKFSRLKEFWAISNHINDIREIMNIQNRKNIEIINLKQNGINNFNELFDIIAYFPNIKKFILTDNGIEEKEAEEMMLKIKEKYGMDIKIILKDEK